MKEWSRLKKTVVISAITLFGLGGMGTLTSPQQNNQVNTPITPVVASPHVQSQTTQTPVQTAPEKDTTPVNSTNTSYPEFEPLNCPNGTYVNTDGSTVCSPYSAPTASAGATAQCIDGTYSFSMHHSGTCSHHGGVAQWL